MPPRDMILVAKRKIFLVEKGYREEDYDTWYNKWGALKSKQKDNCNLSFEDYVSIAKESNIEKPSDIAINGYHLGRYGDTGPYETNNCRFIHYTQNLKERKENGGDARRDEKLKQKGYSRIIKSHWDSLTEEERKERTRNMGAPVYERICPHCGLIGKGSNMTRYHFDKCKRKSI